MNRPYTAQSPYSLAPTERIRHRGRRDTADYGDLRTDAIPTYPEDDFDDYDSLENFDDYGPNDGPIDYASIDGLDFEVMIDAPDTALIVASGDEPTALSLGEA
ncbi:MAG: hypothetical protein ACPGVG_04755, partial [Mycobacterium sp.]